jgi:dTDP-4-dehydrorhamnose 3,5-epimerase
VEIGTFSIPGLITLKPAVFGDDRGSFQESYNKKRFAEYGITDDFVQDNQSVSKANVLRGLHFQAPPFAQAKLVRVTRGAALDVAVDIRKGSPTYGKYEAVLLTAENNVLFYIPAGFAHGFVALEDHTIFQYKCSAYYDKASEGSLLWNDPQLAINWNVTNPLLSPKDLEGQSFASFNSPFIF